MGQIINGKEIGQKIRESIAERVEELKNKVLLRDLLLF